MLLGQNTVLYPQDTVTELKKKFHALSPKFYPARQQLALPPKQGQKKGEALKNGSMTLGDCGLTDGSVVQFKDLGPQVGSAPAQVKPGTWASQQQQHDAQISTVLDV